MIGFNIKKQIALCLVFLFLSWGLTLLAQETDTAFNTGMNRIDSLLGHAVQEHMIPGGVAYIEYKEKVLLHKAYGLANMEEAQSMQKDHIFRLASMTKALTAVGILQLVEKGWIDLDDPLDKYLPWFKNMEILDSVLPDSSFISHPTHKKILIRHLLTHTSGIGYGFQNEAYNKLVLYHEVSEGFCEDQRDSKENTQRISQIPLLSEPGNRYIYSMSYDVLGTLIEIVSNLRYDIYIKENILDPLGMRDSYFIVPKSERNRLVEVYQPDSINSGLIKTLYEDIDYPLLEERQFYSGGADLCGTAGDYVKFMTMLFNRGRFNDKTILGPGYVNQMLSKQSDLAEEDSYQGFGTWITNDKGAAKGPFKEGSYGFGGFFDTYAWVDPSQDLKAVLLLQMYPTNQAGIHEKFQTIVYQSLPLDDYEKMD